jgi:DNA polymerase/3'-5' exonuclease PolX
LYGLEGYRWTLQIKKKELLATRDEFTQEADRENENFKSLAYRTFAKSMDIMEDIFSNIENVGYS